MVKIDHHNLKYLLEQKIGTPMQQKWLSKLLGYDYIVECKKGADNKVADALSRVVEEEVSLALIYVPTLEWVDETITGYEED